MSMPGVARRIVLIGAATAAFPRPSPASSNRATALIAEFIAGATPIIGGIALDVPTLVENGNAVAISIAVEAPTGATQEIAVFADGNPLPEVLRMRFGPAAGPIQVAARIRLADSQTVTALARMADGSVRKTEVEALVTLAACLE